ncbi:MAG: 16S rRNA (adenine(1518)-N(6)/adenine(1519)-N(6))-dimethyltransferase RsmA [bacterium]
MDYNRQERTLLKPIKSLGQSFLTYEPFADVLIDALELKDDDTVLEIGPGKGILTRRLVKKCHTVIAVEIDIRLVRLLEKQMGQWSNLKIVHQDFRKFDINQFKGLKIIGNLPYNISSDVLYKLLTDTDSWQRAILTTQREFAERLFAQPGTKGYGVITLLCKNLCQTRRLFNIPSRFFKPIPKVTSTAFALIRLPRSEVTISDQVWFLKLLRAGFSPQPRKKLVNNLALNLGIDKEKLNRIFIELNLPIDSRARDFTLKQFALLAQGLFSLRQ